LNGHAWKEISHAINHKFAGRDDIEHKFGRTPENVKDKWKQMGGEHAGARNRGPWSIEEAL
jgi:Myb-like DNA-binding domain